MLNSKYMETIWFSGYCYHYELRYAGTGTWLAIGLNRQRFEVIFPKNLLFDLLVEAFQGYHPSMDMQVPKYIVGPAFDTR